MSTSVSATQEHSEPSVQSVPAMLYLWGAGEVCGGGGVVVWGGMD